MRWKTQWKQLLLLLAVLVVLGVLQADQELKPLPDAVITTVQQRVETPKPQWTASGDGTMLVNAFQTYGFVAFSFVVLMAAQNLVQLRTPIQLTRYPTWKAYRKRTFCRLMAFSTVFWAIASALLFVVERTALLTGLAERYFITRQFYFVPFAVYIVHMLLCTALLCLYQTKAVFAKHYIVTQAIPMLFFVASGVQQGTWIQQISPFSFPVYDGLPEGGWIRVVLTYALCFAQSPVLRQSAYSVHDAYALALGNPVQMYACGYGSQWNSFSYCYLAMLILTGVFVYSNCYAYPEGFRTLSILRFGSERSYWKHTMRRNGKYVAFASAVPLLCVFAANAVGTVKHGLGTVQVVPYDSFSAVYVLLWVKLFAFLGMLIVFAEVFSQTISRAGIIGILVVVTVILFSIDLLQQQSALLAIGSWQQQLIAILVFVVVQAALLIYGTRRPLKI